MNNREFASLFRRGVNEHFAGKTPVNQPPNSMDLLIQRHSVASRLEGRMKWESENPTERTAAERMREYEQRKD